MSRLYMRTSAEAHMYMDQQPCTCGDIEFDRQSAAMSDGGVLCSRYSGKCRTCGTMREFILELPPVQRPLTNGVEFGGSDPSRLLDPGQWMAISEYYARLEPGTPEDLDIARAALEEVIKFLPDGADHVPGEAFWTERGRAVHAGEPGRFRRARLAAIRDAYGKRLASYDLTQIAVAWKHTGDAEFPYTADVRSQRFTIRVNDFPAEPLYTLIAEGRDLQHLDDWPAAWVKPGPPQQLLDLLEPRTEPGPRVQPAVVAPVTPLHPNAQVSTWTGRVVCSGIDGRPGELSRVAFSPDSQRFAAGDAKGALVVRDRKGAVVMETQVPSGEGATLVAWSPDGAYIATSRRKEVRLWRSSDLAEVAHEKGISGRLAFGGGGKWLAVLDWRTVRLRRVPSLESIGLFEVDDGGYNNTNADCLAADPTGSTIAVFDRGGYEDDDTNHIASSATPKMTLIAAEKMSVESVREFRSRNPYDLEFDPWRRRILILNDQKIGAWSLAGEPFREFEPWAAIRGRFGEGGQAIAVSKDHVVSVVMKKAVTGFIEVIEFLDPATFRRLASVALPPKVKPRWIAVSPDGSTVVTPGLPVDGKFGMQLWSVES